MSTTIVLAAICLILLICVVYYQGLIKDLPAVTSTVTGIGNMLSGRNSQGVFQAYPTGA